MGSRISDDRDSLDFWRREARLLREQRDALLTALQEQAVWLERQARRFGLPTWGPMPIELHAWLAELLHRFRRLAERLENHKVAPGKPRLTREGICDWPPCQRRFVQPTGRRRMTCSPECTGRRTAWMTRHYWALFGLTSQRHRKRELRLRELPNFEAER